MDSKTKGNASKRAPASKPISRDVDMDGQEDTTPLQDRPENDDEDNDMEMQDDRESSDEGSDVEDDEDQELRTNNASSQKKEAHTSDRVQKIMTNPEIEAAFHDQYMTQITQAFGDELNTLRETDSLEDSHLELLIDSLNQTGHIYRVLEKELWVAGDQ
ncbi:hypothetical protein BGZ72_006383 [Mortierella alpina]|nr:hypothetical protein BGZ72_006383 [Mortierella alpina]